MGCRDGCTQTGIIVKVAFVIVFISMFCNWLAFTTNSWYRNETRDFYVGLWRTCNSMSCIQTDGIGLVKFGVVQAFAVVGFMTQNVGFLLIVLYMFKGNCRGNNEVRLASGSLLIISMIGWLISVAIYGSMETDNAEFLHYSYALAVCACGLGLLGGIFMLVGGRGLANETVNSRKNVLDVPM